MEPEDSGISSLEPAVAGNSSIIASSETEIKVEYLRHSWTVRNFSHCYQEYLENYVHLNRGDETLVWSIKIYPKGNGENNKDFVFLCLNRVVSNPTGAKNNKLGFRSKFLLRSAENKEIEMRVHPNPSHSDYVSYIKRDVLFPLIQPHDSITVFVEIDVAVETITTSSHDSLPSVTNSEKELSKNLLSLFDNEQHSDFTIKTKGKEFRVHKAILSARSPVFSAMLEHENTEEVRSGIVNVTDIDSDVMKAMLMFMYSGHYNDDIDFAESLLIAADKYRLEDLKQHCEKTLINNINAENVCQLVLLGDIYSAKNLRERAITMIQKNPTQVTKTEGWDSIVTEHPQLVTEIIRSFDKHLSSTIGPEKIPGVPTRSGTPQM